MVNLPVRIVEGHGVDDIGVLFEGKEFFAGVGVPYFAGAIVGTSNKSVSRFVERAVGQR